MEKFIDIVIVGPKSKYLDSLKKDIYKCLFTLRKKGYISEITNIEDILDSNINSVPSVLINGKIVFEKEIPNSLLLMETLKTY